jgi:hypothetical protein
MEPKRLSYVFADLTAWHTDPIMDEGRHQHTWRVTAFYNATPFREQWGRFCAERRLWYHVARVNTGKRFRLAHGSGATSTDGSSATKFADTLPLLVNAAAQPDLYDPRRHLST